MTYKNLILEESWDNLHEELQLNHRFFLLDDLPYDQTGL